MELEFLGIGSAFNKEEDNTSAFFYEGDEMFLIDSGETVYKTLLRNDLLDEGGVLNILLTHTHADHVGSLGSLVLYAFHQAKKKVNIILPDDSEYIKEIEAELKRRGCKKETYNIITDKSCDDKYNSFQNVRYVRTSHTPVLMCYSIVFNTKNGIIYYSGDTSEIDTLMTIIISGKQIDKIYIDTSTNTKEANVHLQLANTYFTIPKELHSKIYCMHFNDSNCKRMAEILGFNITTVSDKIVFDAAYEYRKHKQLIKEKSTSNS